MAQDEREAQLTELADGLLASPEWDRWLVEHPDAQAEVTTMRQVRLLAAELRTQHTAVPADFEAQVMARVRRDATLNALLHFGLPNIGSALLEFLSALVGLLPQPADESASVPGGV